MLMIAILLVYVGCSTGEKTPDDQLTHYGNDFTIESTIRVSDAVDLIDEYDSAQLAVTGTISDVCQSKGCWMTVKDNGKTVRVRFVDYSFFVPRESSGKEVRIEGTLKKQIVSEEVARHWAEESSDPDLNPDDIHGDQEMIMMTATAVAIKGGSAITDSQQAVIEGREEPSHQH